MTPNIINEKIIINIRISKYFVKFLTIYCLGDIIPLNKNKRYNKDRNMKQTIKLRESELKRIISESVRRVLNEASTRFSMGRGELSVDASYYRIEKALEGLKRIADTMAETNYYETEESALRSQISYIEQEIDYLRTAMSRDCKSL